MVDRKGFNNRWKFINCLCIFDVGVVRLRIIIEVGVKIFRNWYYMIVLVKC